jgi:hypothetical protein
MKEPTQPVIEKSDLHDVYNAIVGYHNNLVHMRFTVAGLYLAATGFLVGGMDKVSQDISQIIPLLGLALTAIAWLLEVRTYTLLENLGKKGLEIEGNFALGEVNGFFKLMERQPLAPRLPFIRVRITVFPRFVRYIVSHSFGLDLLYGVIALFWLYIKFT